MPFLPNFQIFSKPDRSGHRYFTVSAVGTDYNSLTVAAEGDILGAHYDYVLIRRISIRHSATIGVTMWLYIYTEPSTKFVYLPARITTRNPDVMVWDNLSILCRDVGEPGRDWVTAWAYDYAATDDAYLIIEGECW